MHDRTRRTVLTLGCLGLMGASLSLAACSDRPEVQRSVAQVQRAVGEGAQGALAQRPARQPLPVALEESAVQNAPSLNGAVPAILPRAAEIPVSALPRLHPDGDAVAFDSDRNHQDVTTARSNGRLGVAWHDASEGMWFASTDLQGRPAAAPVQLRAIVSEEEGLSAPAVVAAGDAFGVAWVDAENGRVRFQMVGADGASRGASTIVHEGLTDPRSVALVYNGREFAVAARLGEGVYFTRVDAQGHRLDVGQLFAEGESVDGVESVRWDGRAWSVAFSVAREGAVERREQRVTNARSMALHLSRRVPAPLFM
ncbi:MAG: hypothetical protein JWM10_3988 [Myxococcaceae bacterium]|nr:hypothetical protein [Myxococcaceae bacterium]